MAISCTTCSRTFPTRRSYMTHLREHKHPRPSRKGSRVIYHPQINGVFSCSDAHSRLVKLIIVQVAHATKMVSFFLTTHAHHLLSLWMASTLSQIGRLSNLQSSLTSRCCAQRRILINCSASGLQRTLLTAQVLIQFTPLTKECCRRSTAYHGAVLRGILSEFAGMARLLRHRRLGSIPSTLYMLRTHSKCQKLCSEYATSKTSSTRQHSASSHRLEGHVIQSICRASGPGRNPCVISFSDVSASHLGPRTSFQFLLSRTRLRATQQLTVQCLQQSLRDRTRPQCP